ncbi:MAG: 16S rRNA (cytosine(1402)-N(4))-methyltransferase RsmH [Chitinophagaceae bacterium]|nr:MAG: 16S rRNA (cytosine(1402)-N(4))-methyltransferase RsmH [Chitinophagaceae bacterium]
MPDKTPRKSYHEPVMLQEVIEALQIIPGGIYADMTFGGGGHSKAILLQLNKEGKLIAFDQDEDAWKNAIDDPRFLLVKENFRHLQRFLKLYHMIPAEGILADLGVSSHQFDTAGRGFSMQQNALLDMRMDRRQTLTAKDILRSYDPAALQEIFEQYGEVPNARTLAYRIVEARKTFPIETVAELTAIAGGVSRGNPARYLAQVFQALRITVNDELNALREMLEQSVSVLKPDGRLVIITFHSLEDRIVKEFMKNEKRLNIVYKKPLVPSFEEIKRNPRARSAKLRVAKKGAVE